MKVIRGTLVHCICPESIEVLENYVIGFNEKENGEVFIMNVQAAPTSRMRYTSSWVTSGSLDLGYYVGKVGFVVLSLTTSYV